MKYISTRGQAPAIDFRDALLSGLAPDGGLYLPENWPHLDSEFIKELKNKPFSYATARLLEQYVGDALDLSTLINIADRAYESFSHPDVAPLTKLGPDIHLLELYHGPTLAFKDVAMQMLGQLYQHFLEAAGQKKTIIGATSGDTGGAAIEAFSGVTGVDLFMLHPKGRISNVQRRIMTTTKGDNIVNIAVDGSFDDCQRIVKQMFGDHSLNDRFDLSGVNSINWVRLAIQSAYYFTTLARLEKPASFVVPTGNFGDVFAGYIAKKMGAPVKSLAVAVNENDIMDRAIRTGAYAVSQVRATQSPSMDIQVASNFERLLFEASGRDAQKISLLMDDFSALGSLEIPTGMHEFITRDFVSARADEAEVSNMMKRHYESDALLVDPHTSVGLVAADKLRAENKLGGEIVVLATAHPAKFPDAVKAATGVSPGLPPQYSDLYERPERFVEAPADFGAITKIMMDHR